MSNRAFFITPIRGRWGKVKGYAVSDGEHEIRLSEFDYFTIVTDEPIEKKLLWRGEPPTPGVVTSYKENK